VILFADQERLKNWYIRRTGHQPSPVAHALGSGTEDEILGVFIYDGWNGASCEMHMAGSEGWLTRQFLWAAFDYPFNQCGLSVVYTVISSANTRSLKIVKGFGAKILATIRDGHPDGDLHIVTLYKDDCRWLKEKRYG